MLDVKIPPGVIEISQIINFIFYNTKFDIFEFLLQTNLILLFFNFLNQIFTIRVFFLSSYKNFSYHSVHLFGNNVEYEIYHEFQSNYRF